MLSPAWPSSRSLRNISTPVQVVFCVALRPTISISSPVWTIPCSTLPVTTVPRPVIENTSSIGIRNGLSRSRSGSGMYSSTAAISSMICSWRASASPSSAFSAETLTTGVSSPGNSYSVQQLADLELDELEELLVVDHVDLVERHHDRGHADLAGEQHVLTGLGHRTVRGATTRIAPSTWAAPVIMFLM